MRTGCKTVAFKRPGPRRSKTISAQGLLGQRGINLIERIVLEMKSLWTPTGPNEIGIDGYIEFFNPESSEPLGLTVAVQSKVRSALGTEQSPTFTFSCKRADVEYWLSGNVPVVLIVSNPAANEAYWVPIKDYFKNRSLEETSSIVFNKSDQRFSAKSFQELAAIATPNEGLYLATAPKTEVLHSNLLSIEAFPEYIYVGDTGCPYARDVWALLRKHGNTDAGWVIRNKRLMSFHDLSASPWVEICDPGTIEKFTTTDWSESADADRQRVFVQLLNQTLRAQLSPEVRYWSGEDCFAIVGNRPKQLSYRSLKRQARISVISRYSSTAKTGHTYERLRHMALRAQFRRIDTKWYLELTPTYRFTRDGFELDRFHEEGLRGIKRIEGNRAVLSGVLFWADYLRHDNTLFAKVAEPIQFGHLMTFDATSGINDADWSSNNAESEDESGALSDTFLLLSHEE